MRTNTSVSLEEKIIEAIKAEAEKDGRNFSNMVEVILRDYIAKKDKEEK